LVEQQISFRRTEAFHGKGFIGSKVYRGFSLDKGDEAEMASD
jgi:hypothetical protein